MRASCLRAVKATLSWICLASGYDEISDKRSDV